METWVIELLTPARRTAAAESPPATIEVASEPATALAISTVPNAQLLISNTPIGPFQMMVLEFSMTCLNRSMVRGPISSAVFWSGTDRIGQCSTCTLGLRLDPTTWSTGSNTSTPACLA